MKGKIHPGGISEVKDGPTLTGSHPSKFHGPGKTSGKIKSSSAQSQSTGPTHIENKPIVNMPKANTHPASSKVVGSIKTGGFKLGGHGTAAGGQPQPPYGLKDSYDKSGKTMSHKVKSIL
jgi:hypothetical protein